MGTPGTGVFPVWSGGCSLPYPWRLLLLVLLLEQTFSQCVEWSAWHSSGYKYWGIFPLPEQKSQWCPHWALAACSGFCSALISFPFALALKELKHPEWIISVPQDCHFSLAAFAVRPFRGTSTLQHQKHPPASPQCSGEQRTPENTGVRVSGSQSPLKCDTHEKCCCSCKASLCPQCPCECPDLFCISSTSWLRRCPLAEYPTF